MKDLIPITELRCCNHRCSLRTDCKRYLQREIDKANATEGVKVTRHGENDQTVKCFHQLRIEKQ